jgi:hypothetical protein
MSVYLPDTKTLFLHIPRTGGTWTASALHKIELPSRSWGGWLSTKEQGHKLPANHCLLNHFHPAELVTVEQVFAFVRHPVAYYASVWKWLNYGRMRKQWLWHPFRNAAKLYSPNINIWASRMMEAEPCWYTRLLEMYVGPEDGEHCFYIGRNESLVPDLISVLHHLGYKLTGSQLQTLRTLKPINNSNIKVEWNNSVVEQVKHSERLVIERFYIGQKSRRRFYAPQIKVDAAWLASQLARRIKTC